jgi:hypothetical protein
MFWLNQKLFANAEDVFLIRVPYHSPKMVTESATD